MVGYQMGIVHKGKVVKEQRVWFHSTTRWSWTLIWPLVLFVWDHTSTHTYGYQQAKTKCLDLRSVPTCSVPWLLTVWTFACSGGVNTYSRALAALLVPLDGERLVKVCVSVVLPLTGSDGMFNSIFESLINSPWLLPRRMFPALLNNVRSNQ
jgi:hypothetical protein